MHIFFPRCKCCIPEAADSKWLRPLPLLWEIHGFSLNGDNADDVPTVGFEACKGFPSTVIRGTTTTAGPAPNKQASTPQNLMVAYTMFPGFGSQALPYPAREARLERSLFKSSGSFSAPSRKDVLPSTSRYVLEQALPSIVTAPSVNAFKNPLNSTWNYMLSEVLWLTTPSPS